MYVDRYRWNQRMRRNETDASNELDEPDIIDFGVSPWDNLQGASHDQAVSSRQEVFQDQKESGHLSER